MHKDSPIVRYLIFRVLLSLVFLAGILVFYNQWQGVSSRGIASHRPAAHDGIQPDVPFEPTPYPVVDAMLEIAEVNGNDVVYDLGCGDGRMVIRAAQRMGARGVGIDIDPRRIEASKNNAQRAGVKHLVSFIEEDLFKADISQATVVLLFLSPETNLRLRDKLLKELRPGTRIVSHEHDMGEWKAEKRMKIGEHIIYCYVVPASPIRATVTDGGRLAIDESGAPFPLLTPSRTGHGASCCLTRSPRVAQG